MQLGYMVDWQKPIDIEYEDLRFEAAFRIDLQVDRQVLIEVKSVERLNGAHAKQLLTYLRLTRQPLRGCLSILAATLKEGFRRLVNDY